jgi:hypothetical protein
MPKAIFIAGCGRSGTTLVRDLMTCFADTFVYGPHQRMHLSGKGGFESPFSTFARLRSRGVQENIVIKRTYNCAETLHLLPSEIELLYCVRNPYAVLTSTHPRTAGKRCFHITPERWLTEYRALSTLRAVQPNRRIVLVRYEDVVTAPNTAQANISKAFELRQVRSFEDNPLGLTIESDRIHKWRSDPARVQYVAGLKPAVTDMIARFNMEFGYPPPQHYWGSQVDASRAS